MPKYSKTSFGNGGLLRLSFTTAVGAFLLLPVGLVAQSGPTTNRTSASKAASTAPKPGATKRVRPRVAASSTQPKLPASIPAVPGPVHTQFEMRYVDIKVGDGAPALPGQIYTVHYTGWLYDGTKFDSSVDRNQPFDFPQGQKRVITGWDIGFEGMRVGGKRRLFIPYQLAYGELGRDPIPPKANLIFDVELLGVSGGIPRP